MSIVKLSLIVLAFVVSGFAPANAATTTKSYSFDATLVSGELYCGANAFLAEPCSGDFGTFAATKAELLMLGKSKNGVYRGRIELGFEGDDFSYAACDLGGADCFFDDAYLNGPFGDDAELNFSRTSEVLSKFYLGEETGSYFFGTDYFTDEDGTRYYSGVRFDLTDVERADVAIVPLMGSAAFLVFALGGFAAVSRRKSSTA